MAEAGYPMRDGAGFPAVDALAPARADITIEYLQTQWRENLGIEITWQTMELGMLLDWLRIESPHMYSLAWGADYLDPDAFLRVGVADIRRYNQWQNKTYDKLVEEARRVMDQGERMKLYAQADQILIEEVAIMSVHYRRGHLLVKPWVSRYPTSATQDAFWKDVIIEPH